VTRTRTLGSRLPREPIAQRLLHPRRRRDALVLSGGGSRASFEIGALRYLYDVVGIEPAVIAGTSAGSVLAAVLAQGADAAAQRRSLDDLERIWRSLTTSSDMFEETDWFATLRRIAPEWVEVFQRRRRVVAPPPWLARAAARPEEDVDVPADAPLWAPFRSVEALLALRTLGRTGRDLERVLDSAERSQGVFVPGRIADLVQDPAVFDPARVARSGVRLRIAVVGLESGELRYVTEDGRLVDRSDRPVEGAGPVDLADAVRASSAIPVVFPPVPLAGEHYVDGGVREVLPLEVAARHLRATRCFAVVASAGGSRPEASYADRNLVAIMYRSYSDIMWDEVLRDEVELARASSTVTLIQPELDVHDGLTVDPGLIAIAMDYGYMRAADVVRRADEAQCRLTRDIVELRREIWATENARSGPADPADVATVVRGRLGVGTSGIAGGDLGPGAPLGSGGTGGAGTVGTPGTPTRDDLADDAGLAALKHRLRDLIAAKDPTHLPDDAERWWQDWERHAWPTPDAPVWTEPPADS
jgi:NTE family protein